MSEGKSVEELLRFLRGIEKKHGSDVELVVKVRTNSGKVQRRTGAYLGVQGSSQAGTSEVGLRNEKKGADTWYSLERVLDIWKRGAPPE